MTPCPSGECMQLKLVPVFGRRDLVVGYVARDVVSGHDVLHLALVFAHIIAVVLAGVFFPLVIHLVELTLIGGGKPALRVATISVVVAIAVVVWRGVLRVGSVSILVLITSLIAISSPARDLIKGDVWWNVVARHDVLHFADIAFHVISIVLAAVVLIFRINTIELALVVRRKPAVLA